MEDFEKNRIEYVQQLETQVQHLQNQLADLKAQERWIPKVGSSMNTSAEKVRLTLSFNGKNQTVELTYDNLRSYSANDLTTNILMAMQDMVNDQLRPVVKEEVIKLQAGAMKIWKAGQW